MLVAHLWPKGRLESFFTQLKKLKSEKNWDITKL